MYMFTWAKIRTCADVNIKNKRVVQNVVKKLNVAILEDVKARITKTHLYTNGQSLLM